MRGQPVVFEDFRSGINLLGAPYSLDDIQARDARNVRSNTLGGISKRNGFGSIATPAKPITSLSTFNGASDVLVGVGDDGAATDLYKITLGGTVTSIKAALTITPGYRWDFIQAPQDAGLTQGPLWFMNGQDTPLEWTGSGDATTWTATTSGSVPNGKYLCYFHNRVFVAGESANPSRLYWSGLGDPGDWLPPSGGYTTFDPDDGEPITGLGVVGDYLLVFKPNKAYVVFDTDTGGYRQISSEIGCRAHRSIIETHAGTFFLSSDNEVMATDGSTISHLGNELGPILNAIPGAVHKNCAAVYYKSSYFLSVPEVDENSIILEYNLDFNSWWLHEIQIASGTTTGVNDWAIANMTTTNDLYCTSGDATYPKILEAFKSQTYQDLTNNYQAYWISQWHTFGLPHLRKILRQIRADGLGQFDCYYSKSFSTSYSLTDDVIWEYADEDTGGIFGGGSGLFGSSGTFGGTRTVQEHRYYTVDTGRAFSLKFISETSGMWDLYAYTMAIDSRRD